MSRASREERKSKREERRERLAKTLFMRQGMEWSENDALRGDAWSAGVEATRGAGLIDEDTFKQLRNLGMAIASGTWLAALGPLLKLMETKREIVDVFASGWNPIIIQGVPPEVEAPRYQVDFGEVGRGLPWQSVAMVTPKKSGMPTWVLPAFGLVAVAYLWSSKK